MHNKLTVDLKNCYGIENLTQVFDFSRNIKHSSVNSAYAIYAPNGLMKTSFAKTFADLGKVLYGRPPECQADFYDLA